MFDLVVSLTLLKANILNYIVIPNYYNVHVQYCAKGFF